MTHKIPSYFTTEPEQTAYSQGYLAGHSEGVESVWKSIFGKSSCDYSGSREQYYISVPFAYEDITPNETGMKLACKYNKKFKKMFDEIQVENAQREKENYG